MNAKEEIIAWVEKEENEVFLEVVVDWLNGLPSNAPGELWEGLTPQEKKEVIESWEEAQDSNKLVSHDEMKEQLKRWH